MRDPRTSSPRGPRGGQISAEGSQKLVLSLELHQVLFELLIVLLELFNVVLQPLNLSRAAHEVEPEGVPIFRYFADCPFGVLWCD